MLRDFLLVGLGGAFGSMARYGVSILINETWSKPFPLATVLINLVGCLVIGILYGLSGKYSWPGTGINWLLLATGICGGFTTFSAFALENVKLMEGELNIVALMNIAVSVIGGIICCWLGVQVAR